MKSSILGSARTFLLAALALAAALMVTAVALIATRGCGGPGGDAVRPDEPTDVVPGRPRDPGQRRETPDDTIEDPDDPNDPEGVIKEFPGVDPNRKADGLEYWVTGDTLRAVMKGRHWEEIRRMIDVLQAQGNPVPADVVKELVAMLSQEDLRIDAILALGGVKDEPTAKVLADLAVSSQADPEARKAALDVLAKTGPKSALAALQQLVADESVDEDVARHAYPALAQVGGPEATKTLIDLLVKHMDDDQQGALAVALGKAKDADTGLASIVRSSRDGGDMRLISAALHAALFQREAMGPELKAELLRIIESSATLTAFPDEIDKLRVQGAAMPAAVAAGLVDPVLREATTSGMQRDIALNALLQARGDDAARKIASAIVSSKDEIVRRQLTVALGETGSRAVTGTLVSLLGDEDPNTRRAAARSLGQVRDASSVKPILATLSRATDDYDFANYLVQSLGTIGSKEALEPLRKLATSEEAFWRQLRPFIRNAINRIETQDPASLRLSKDADEQAGK